MGTAMKLKEIHLNGYKSVDSLTGQIIPLDDVTVLLGANGSGKSNLVSFFSMLSSMAAGGLQQYVGKQGVSRLLYYGPKQTESVQFRLEFESDGMRGSYDAKLSHGIPDRLFFNREQVVCHEAGMPEPVEYTLAPGTNESGLGADTHEISKILHGLLSGIRTYQFHDTSDTARIKDRCYVDDARFLRGDAGNLAAFLRMMNQAGKYKKYYDRIVRHIRRVMPQFGDFVLDPIPGNENYIRLNWTDSSGDGYLFDPGQISDGSLRFMAIAALLLQPPELLPKFIVLDEPELGLHPSAIGELAGIVRAAAQKTQVLLATQSTRLIDEFLPEDLVVVERDEAAKCSVFKKLDAGQLGDWIARYSLSELWEKNVLGGQP